MFPLWIRLLENHWRHLWICLLHLFFNPCWGVHTEPRQYNLRFIKQVNFLAGPPETSKCLILKPTEACREGSAETNPRSRLNALLHMLFMSLELTVPKVPGEQWCQPRNLMVHRTMLLTDSQSPPHWYKKGSFTQVTMMLVTLIYYWAGCAENGTNTSKWFQDSQSILVNQKQEWILVVWKGCWIPFCLNVLQEMRCCVCDLLWLL